MHLTPPYDLAAARALFPITEQYTYLNHAATSPLSTRVTGAMKALLDDQSRHAGVHFEQVTARVDQARQLAARLINATPDEIAFVRNTSSGLLHVANGLDWRAGDNIVTAAMEFPANVHPWLNLERLGVETRFAPCREGRVPVDALTPFIDSRTRLVAVSFVGYGTGYRYDLAALAEAVHSRGAFLSVDGIQGLGALPLDVRATDIDFMSAGGHKWLMGPAGNGIFYIKRELLDRLTLVSKGWLSVEGFEDFERYDQPLLPTAQRFEEGVKNLVGIYGLGASIDTLLEYGIPAIERHILDLNTLAIEGLKRCGYQVVSPHAHDGERSGILIFKHPTLSAADLEARLRAANVIVSIRAGAIRVAPHFYNSTDDIQRLLDVLP